MSIKEKAWLAAQWWRELATDEFGPRDRAAIARLRHAASPLEAAEEEATITLVRRLDGGIESLERIAVCAGVLAHVRTDDDATVARRIGRTGDPEKRAKMSRLRFRRLIQADTAEDVFVQFRRLVALADRKVNVEDLAAALLDWSDRRKRDWIFRYHMGEPPGADTESVRRSAPQPAFEEAAP